MGRDKDDFIIGAIAGGFIWLAFVGSGSSVPVGTSPIDSALSTIFPDASMGKAFLFFVFIGGLLGMLAGMLKDAFMKQR